MSHICLLQNRHVVEVQGLDAQSFLQGLITNNMEQLSNAENQTPCLYTAFLNHQGRFLSDAFIFSAKNDGDHAPPSFMVDLEQEHIADLLKMFKMYKLRSDVKFIEHSHMFIYASIHHDNNNNPVAAAYRLKDPRHDDLGYRHYTTAPLDAVCNPEALIAYNQTLIEHLIADGSHVIPYQRGFIIEYGFDDIKAIDYTKGCYLGQELTARMHHRKLGKRELVCFKLDPLPASIKRDMKFKHDDVLYGTVVAVCGPWVLMHVQSHLLEGHRATLTSTNRIDIQLNECSFESEDAKVTVPHLLLHARASKPLE